MPLLTPPRVRPAARLAFLPLLFASTPVAAQRANENATRQAEDAFGFSVGNETVGLYNPGSVRGFNPSAAGNIRIDGLYIDQQVELSGRIVEASTIRVGMNTLGYIFPAPSGVVDYSLRAARGEDTLSIRTGIEALLTPFTETDGVLVSADGRLSLNAGIRLNPAENDYRGGEVRSFNVGLIPRWQPTEAFSLTGIFDRGRTRREIAPFYSTAGAFLPPDIQRGTFFGQDWAVLRENGGTTGAIAKLKLSSEWSAKVGLFRSALTQTSNFFDLYRNVTRDGNATRTILAYPEQSYRSLSGELQVERRWTASRARHTLTFAARGRKSNERYGGARFFDFGADRVDRRRRIDRPDLTSFGGRDRDQVEQKTAGLAYRLEYDGRLDLALGVQKTDYQKNFRAAGDPETEGGSTPWLYNGLVGWRFSPKLIVYGSYSRGLEESGVAPNNAANEGEVLPAILTPQGEVGFRTLLGPLRVTISAFDVRKPYASLDAANRFGFAGSVRHRGIETSVAGQPVKGLSIVVGALLLNAEVRGEQRERGLIGKRPITTTPFEIQASADYQLPFLEGASIDAQVGSFAERTSRRDNLADIPPRTLMNLGGRYRFDLFGKPASLRGQIFNLFNNYGATVASGELYNFNVQRRARLILSIDL